MLTVLTDPSAGEFPLCVSHFGHPSKWFTITCREHDYSQSKRERLNGEFEIFLQAHPKLHPDDDRSDAIAIFAEEFDLSEEDQQLIQ